MIFTSTCQMAESAASSTRADAIEGKRLLSRQSGKIHLFLTAIFLNLALDLIIDSFEVVTRFVY